MYQPHPCFAKTESGVLRYHALEKSDVKGFTEIKDFPMTGTRELIAADYVHQIKRMADPRLACPILSTLKDYILGMETYSTALANGQEEATFPGVEVVDRYTYRVILKAKISAVLSTGWRCPSFRRCLKRRSIFTANPL